MGCEQVCLKWNNFSFNITKNIDDLWKDESLVDVSIISEGQCIQAHKVILSASSPLFKSLFAVNPCQHPVIILQDVRFRELVSIITFIYKGEVNILEDSLPALLHAAKTLQIRGLSDSVDRDSLNRLYKINNDNSNDNSSSDESRGKKRKLQKTQHRKSITVEEDESKEEQSNDTIIPKEEPKNDSFSADLFTAVSEDEEEIKPEDIVLQDQTQELLQTDLDQTEGNHAVVGKKIYQEMPFASLLPAAEILLRWSQNRSLDQLAIDLMKRLFTTDERLVCNVNGKMGKPRFHPGKISLLREVLYYYSGLSSDEFEIHWKNCVTKIDTSNRGLKRNKKLRTQMFFMDAYLGKSFT